MKSEIMHHLPAAKHGCLSKNELAGAIQCILYKPKTGCQRQGITSAFAWCCFRRPYPACPANVRAGVRQRRCYLCRCPCTCMQSIIVFCIVLSQKFNIMSALLVQQLAIDRKKSILAKVCFDAKRG